MLKVSDLSEEQKQHLVWRLDHCTVCGLLTALQIAKGKLHRDKTLTEIFLWVGCTPRSAAIHAGKVQRFKLWAR